LPPLSTSSIDETDKIDRSNDREDDFVKKNRLNISLVYAFA